MRWTTQTYWKVAVWWERDGTYGSVKRFHTQEGAAQEIVSLIKLGYQAQQIDVVKVVETKEGPS